MSLEELRKDIDECDTDLINALSKRMKVVKKISKYKKEHKLEVLDEEREEHILQSRKELARELGIDASLVEKIFRDIMDNSREEQS